MKRLLLIAGMLGCGTFEDPDVVLDLRVLAMSSSVPEQVIDIDLTRPPTANEVLGQLVDTEICVLISDNNFERNLRWSMTLCNLDGDLRCGNLPNTSIGSGVWEDPDLSATAPGMCATVPADGNLLAVLLDALESDQFHGLGGIYYGVSLVVGGETADPALDLYAAKNLRVQPRIPAELQANQNPSLASLDIRLDEAGEMMPLAISSSRCVDYQLRGESPIEVVPEQRVRLTPVEPDGVREPYVVPTLDGGSRMFTESLTYQWLSTMGGFSSGSTGGPRDPFGNPATLFTDWTAPKAKDVDGPTDVSLWVVQRDERLGLTWYESCVRVVP